MGAGRQIGTQCFMKETVTQLHKCRAGQKRAGGGSDGVTRPRTELTTAPVWVLPPEQGRSPRPGCRRGLYEAQSRWMACV